MQHHSSSLDHFLWTIVVLLSVATIASAFASSNWVFDTVANLRIQGLVCIIGVVAVSFLLQRWRIDGYRLIATHPVPPIGSLNFHRRNHQLTELAKHIRPGNRRPEGTILLGDFNLTPWNVRFTDLLEASGMRRAAPRWDVRPTWYGKPYFLFGLRIDHVLISDDLVCTSHRIGGDTGSDHRSVTVRLDWR